MQAPSKPLSRFTGILHERALRQKEQDSRLDQKYGLGVSFDLVTGRLALGRKTAASRTMRFAAIGLALRAEAGEADGG